MMNHRCAFSVLAILVVASGVVSSVHAEPPPAASPEINAYYHNADPARWAKIFERPGRELFDRRHDIVAALDLRPGMSVADVGAGTGLFTLLMAKAVGDAGRVYAVDISRPFIDEIRSRATREGFGNIVAVVNDQRDVALPPESVDAIFLADTYHHFEYPRQMLDTMHTALRPGGILSLIDFRRLSGVSTNWIMNHVRAGRSDVIAEVEAAGFDLVDEPLLLQGNYFLRFRRNPG
jgi:predicted methyltransferase